MDEIYSIGDAAFLYGVLQAVAAFAQTGDYDTLARIGLLLGVILVMGRAALSGGTQFPVGQLLGCVLLYSAFFGPSRAVAVIDVYTDEVRTVDHVPVGVALAGSQVSSFGYHISRIMEQAFSTPRMTEQGYGAALETLKRVRLATIAVFSLNLVTAPGPDADWPRSWQQFIADCPLKGWQNENRLKPLGEIWNTPLMTQGLRFDSNLWGTRLDLTRPYTEPTCSEAHRQLIDYTEAEFLPYFREVLARKLRYPNPAALETALADALAALGLTASADAYLLTSALSVVYFQGVRQRHAEDFQPAYATAVDDAVQQRNAQWLADESLFRQYVRPMITFLEGFIFALTPFLVLLVGLGPYGIKVIFGFLTTLIWITTWMPVLAIINFFQHYAAAAKLAALAESGAGIDTMAGLFQADSVVQTYLAVAGNMAAAVPALTAAFLFLGSRAFGANLFAQRLSSGQDTFKEEKVAQDSYFAGPAVNLPAPFTQQPQVGFTTQSNLEALTPRYSWANSLSATVSSAEARSEGVSRSFAETAAQRIAQAAGRSETGMVGGMFTDHEAASRSRSYGVAKDWAASVANEEGGSRGLDDQTRAQIVYGLAAGIPAGQMAERLWDGASRYVPGGEVRGSGSQASSHTAAELERIVGQMAEHWRNDRQFQAQLGSALAHDLRQGHEDTVFASRQLQSDQGLQRQAADVLAANREFRAVSAAGAEWGERVSVSEPELVGMILRDPATRDYVRHEAIMSGLGGETQAIEMGLHRYYPNEPERRIAAELRALGRDAGSELERELLFREIGERLMLAKARDLGDPRANAELGLDPDGIGSVHGTVKDGMAGLGADLAAEAEAELARRAGAVDAGRDRVAGRSAENNAMVGHHQDINRVEATIARDATTEAAKAPGSDANIATSAQNLHQWIVEKAKELPERAKELIEPPPPSVVNQIDPPPPVSSPERAAEGKSAPES